VKDGQVQWVDAAATYSMAIPMSGMGASTLDLNEDGVFDYCISDTGPVRCYLSDGPEAYYDATAVLNLVTASVTEGQTWSAWSMEMLDLDNDGWLDVATAAGAPMGTDAGATAVYRDAIWEGVGATEFVERSADLGFQDVQNNFGLAAADFDGDGYLELVTHTSFGHPQFWQNHCGSDGWLEIDLDGPPENRFAIGARVEVEVGSRRYAQEVQSLRGLGQSPARLHFGLGWKDSADRVTVTWPGGQVTEMEDVEGRRILRLDWPG
jgi:hypothetical protein